LLELEAIERLAMQKPLPPLALPLRSRAQVEELAVARPLDKESCGK
jgi:hypothetical protein